MKDKILKEMQEEFENLFRKIQLETIKKYEKDYNIAWACKIPKIVYAVFEEIEKPKKYIVLNNFASVVNLYTIDELKNMLVDMESEYAKCNIDDWLKDKEYDFVSNNMEQLKEIPTWTLDHIKTYFLEHYDFLIYDDFKELKEDIKRHGFTCNFNGIELNRSNVDKMEELIGA